MTQALCKEGDHPDLGLRIGNLDFANRSCFIFSSFEIVLFSIFSVYCTFCILLVFNGLNRPGLKPYAGRDHPDFGLGIGNLDSATTRKICTSSASNRISDILIFHCS